MKKVKENITANLSLINRSRLSEPPLTIQSPHLQKDLLLLRLLENLERMTHRMDLLVTKDPQIMLLLEDVTATDRSDQEDQEETDPQEGIEAEVEVVVEEETDLILKDKQVQRHHNDHLHWLLYTSTPSLRSPIYQNLMETMITFSITWEKST
ncbi:hypothetical protein FS749_000317 [Ceratobasidium sp. UAMH 11750]|nr:hypothetical protein FS749_000317 [Ceratobasidium sp. UAMH 11750]